MWCFLIFLDCYLPAIIHNFALMRVHHPTPLFTCGTCGWQLDLHIIHSTLKFLAATLSTTLLLNLIITDVIALHCLCSLSTEFSKEAIKFIMALVCWITNCTLPLCVVGEMGAADHLGIKRAQDETK